ncbi:uncharacterized protein F4822DRAFT_104431 [Hypoxylon trugodes]|uniref:uncharacterized protein n=1 Tax=Hypoxylon trugodes TaxID=326681 RepID=UPI002191DCBB|nr:uncharacterized protein F4822DRAFT_104431 [Hypoxylon trugodes]KAI1391744.1 hypothetical protein F4822DRAFT_104431 [Hypoxylon trugodes]
MSPDVQRKPRKNPSEYSTNPNTQRARIRKAGLSEYQRQLEQAKASDSKAVTRAWKIRAETNAFKVATKDQQEAVLESVEQEVLERRRQKGLDAGTKMSRFMEKVGSSNNGNAVASPGSAPLASQSPVASANVGTGISELVVFGPHPGPPATFESFLGYQETPIFSTRHNIGDGSGIDNYNDRPGPIPTIDRAESLQIREANIHNPFLPNRESHHGYMNPQQGLIPVSNNIQFQQDLAAAGTTNAGLEADLNLNRDRIEDLKHQINVLNRDLAIAQSNIAALETRMGLMNSIMATCGDADGCRRIAAGFQVIADFAVGVATTLDHSNGTSDAERDSGVESTP